MFFNNNSNNHLAVHACNKQNCFYGWWNYKVLTFSFKRIIKVTEKFTSSTDKSQKTFVNKKAIWCKTIRI